MQDWTKAWRSAQLLEIDQPHKVGTGPRELRFRTQILRSPSRSAPTAAVVKFPPAINGAISSFGVGFPPHLVGEFPEDIQVISDAKIRASYGLTGNRVGIRLYVAVEPVESDGYSWNNALVQGAQLSSLGNYNSNGEHEITGRRHGPEFLRPAHRPDDDYYNKKTYDLLLNANLPLSSGHQRVIDERRGRAQLRFRATLNTVNIRTKNLCGRLISISRSTVRRCSDSPTATWIRSSTGTRLPERAAL